MLAPLRAHPSLLTGHGRHFISTRRPAVLATSFFRVTPLRFRTLSTEPGQVLSDNPQSRRLLLVRRALKVLRYSGYFLLSSAFGVLTIGAGIFIHDALTYTHKHVHCVPVSPLALHPKSGGPKNLPIARVQVDDEEDEENVKLAEKPRLVIVGGGWGVSAVEPASLIPPHPCNLLHTRRRSASFKACILENTT